MPSIFRKHLISSAWILLCSSAVSVQVSHAYRNIVMTRARINLILCFIMMFLSFQMIFSLASAAIVWAALESTSLLEPSSHIMAPRYLMWFTVSNFCPCIVMSLCKVPLFVIILVFSALISMPNFSAAVSKLCTSSVSSSSSPVIPSMSSAKRRFVILRPPMLMVPLKFSRACVMISSRNMLKRVGESRHPWRTPTDVWNHSPVVPWTNTALIAFS